MKNKVLFFNKEQINRCYQEFDFNENERIIDAWFDTKTKQLYIEYDDAFGGAIYCPAMDSKDDKQRLDYIIYGTTY